MSEGSDSSCNNTLLRRAPPPTGFETEAPARFRLLRGANSSSSSMRSMRAFRPDPREKSFQLGPNSVRSESILGASGPRRSISRGSMVCCGADCETRRLFKSSRVDFLIGSLTSNEGSSSTSCKLLVSSRRSSLAISEFLGRFRCGLSFTVNVTFESLSTTVCSP